jgi:hypothetical protein
MAKSIQLVKQSTVELPDISSYKLVVKAVNAQNMSDKIFVKQRIRNFAKSSLDDTFVAVCTPTQLEDFEEDAPGEGSSYFRTNEIELIGRTPEWMVAVFNSLLYETKKLVVDLTDLDHLNAATTYNITATDAVMELVTAPVVSSVIRSYEDQSATINFIPNSSSSGGSPLDYQYSLDAGTTWRDRLPRSIASPIVLRGLDNSTTYNLKIRAYFGGNYYGPESELVTINTVNPPAVPTAPTITEIIAGTNQLNVIFSADGDSDVVNYEYSINNGSSWTTRSPASITSPLVITGLTSNTNYTVKIRGVNSLGFGVSSSSSTSKTLISP